MLARCPTCRATFSTEKSGQQACPSCGKPLFVPEPAPVLASVSGPQSGAGSGFPRFGEAPADAAEAKEGTPWERRPELSAFAAWLETTKLALFEPRKLYSRARLDQRGAQTSYAVITFSIFSIVGQLIERLFVGPQQQHMLETFKQTMGDRIPPALLKLLDSSTHPTPATAIIAMLVAPAVAFIFLWANAGVTHLCAMLFGQNRKGFAATFAACAYAMAPMVLSPIPACGSIIGVLWIIVLTGIGLKETHGITPGGATATTLGPYLVFCCLTCGMLMMLLSAGASAIPQLLSK